MLSIQQRNKLIQHCIQHTQSSFYTDLYKNKNFEVPETITEEPQWHTIPILEKDDLVSKTMEERSFIPVGQLDHVRASSGTSGKPPLFSPRTHVRNMDYRLQYHEFKNAFLTFSAPMMPHWHERVQSEQGITPQVITLDPREPEVTARLSKIAGVDAVSLFAYQLHTIGEAMKKEGINTNIRFVELTGETCSRARYEYMRNTFPNAVLLHSYGASEVEDVHIGMPCRPMTNQDPLTLYHPKHTHFLEILDPHTQKVIEPLPGVEGELLITAYPGEPSAFPLIRFRIGDTIKVIDQDCGHGSWSFDVLGRTELDFLKVEGGVLRADEVERVLGLFAEYVEDEFELHRYERSNVSGPSTQAELYIEPKQEINLDDFATQIATQLRISPTRTYADAVASGSLLPLICRKKIQAQEGNKKRRRMVSH